VDGTSSELQRLDVSRVTKVRPVVGNPDDDEESSLSLVVGGAHSQRTVDSRGNPNDDEEFSLPFPVHDGFDISSIYRQMNPDDNDESSFGSSVLSAAKDDEATGQ
jgi:hypothetical protein